MNKNVLHVVSVSGHTSSAAALLRVVDRYAHETIRPVFCDTNWENEDTYSFVSQLEQRTGIAITKIDNDGKTPADISEQESMIFNSRVANCTIELKVKPIERLVSTLQNDGYTVMMHIGYNIADRYKRARSDKPFGRLLSPVLNWRKLGVVVKYPLWWYPRVINPDEYCRENGLHLPASYIHDENFVFKTTKNCSGGCFKQGVIYWRGLYVSDRETFKSRMMWENKMRQNTKYHDYAICTRTVNGQKRAYPLHEIAEDTERMLRTPKQMRLQLFYDDIGETCGAECHGE